MINATDKLDENSDHELGDLNLDDSDHDQEPETPTIPTSRSNETAAKKQKQQLGLRQIASDNLHLNMNSADHVDKYYIQNRIGSPQQITKSSSKIIGLVSRVSVKFNKLKVFNRPSKNVLSSIDENKVHDGKKKKKKLPKTPPPKQIGLKDFVKIVGLIIEELQSLNYQSITRWKKTDEFANLQQKVDLHSLANHLRSPTVDINNNGNSTPRTPQTPRTPPRSPI